jgi:glyoxylase-like metal-dependent hydrolase (beta-lactamase superfamily II)
MNKDLGAMNPTVTALFDEATNTVTYIVADPATAKAAIVDCVLDFNPKSARISTRSADRLIEAVRRQDLEVEWVLQTHVHADHLSAAPYIKEKRSSYFTGAQINQPVVLWRGFDIAVVAG